MPYTVRFTRRALADVDAAVAYRSQRSATAAARWRVGLLAQVAALEQFPNRCPLADEADNLGLELRELLYGRRRNIHRILFTIEDQTVIIHRVRHAAQDRLAPGDIYPLRNGHSYKHYSLLPEIWCQPLSSDAIAPTIFWTSSCCSLV